MNLIQVITNIDILNLSIIFYTRRLRSPITVKKLRKIFAIGEDKILYRLANNHYIIYMSTVTRAALSYSEFSHPSYNDSHPQIKTVSVTLKFDFRNNLIFKYLI